MSTMPTLPFPLEPATQPMAGRLTTLGTVLDYVLAGSATITIRSKVTGNRFTYKIRKAKEEAGKEAVWFVSLMRGADNENDFCYMGVLRPRKNLFNKILEFVVPARSKVNPRAPGVVAFTWVWRQLVEKSTLPTSVEIWHTGQCGRCGRKLTVPESVSAGIGPECARKMGGF